MSSSVNGEREMKGEGQGGNLYSAPLSFCQNLHPLTLLLAHLPEASHLVLPPT